MLRVTTSRLLSVDSRVALRSFASCGNTSRRMLTVGMIGGLGSASSASCSVLAMSQRYNVSRSSSASASFTTDSDRAELNSREQAAARKQGASSSAASRTSAPAAEEENDDYQAEGGRMEKDADGNLRYYNPWEVLGLKPGASAHDIRLRYHELLQECHPEYVKGGKEADVIRLNQINKAYEIITKSPTLDKRYRNLVSDTQRMYYKILPEWIAKNVDEQPRYISWVRWRVPSLLQIVFLLIGLYAVGRFYKEFPVFTIVFFSCVTFDYLFHTMSAPFALSMLFLSAVVSNQTYTMSWLVSPRSMLQGGLGY